jgi:Phage Tail Collar Domain
VAQLTKFPIPDENADWHVWAKLLTQVLQNQFGNMEQASPAGLILFKGKVPQGYLPANGTTFSAKAYPALASFLGGATLPNVAAPAGFTYGLKAK